MSCSRLTISFVKAALLALILSVAPASSFQNSDRARARLLMSYGHPQPSDELEANLDFLAETLKKNAGSYACVIVYRGYNNPPSFFHSFNPPGIFHRHAVGVRSYLNKVKNVPTERIVMVDGGLRQHFQADVWIVAEGEKPPAPSPDTSPFIQEANGLFDEYICDSESDLAASFHSVRLDGFAKALVSEPGTLGYIIGYAQCLDISEAKLVSRNGSNYYVTRQYKKCDPSGTGARIGTAEKQDLFKLYGIPRSRVTVIDGGYRNSRMVQLWVVPNGAESPKAMPTEDPRR